MRRTRRHARRSRARRGNARRWPRPSARDASSEAEKMAREIRVCAAAEGRRRRGQRHSRGARRDRRRRGRVVRGRSLPHVCQICGVRRAGRSTCCRRAKGTAGGYKEIIAEIVGRGAFARLKYESGVHRVQRVPATETQGRIHTSAATVAVMPEAREIDFDIDEADLKIDTMRSSGAGGQHVNKTEIGDPHHASADRRRRRDAGGALAAPQPRQGDGAAAVAHSRRKATEGRR